MTYWARNGTSFTWHRLSDRYGWVCGIRTRITACGHELLPDRTQIVRERPERLCAACERAK